jgi:O-antigen/teichoic acid export membrane protein
LNTKESEKLIKRDIENTIKIFIFVSLGGIILITSIARYLVLFISTPEYINSAFMVYFLIIAQSIFFFTRIIGIGVFIKEKTGIELLISIFSIVLGLISSIFLGDKFGVFGYLSSFLIFVLVRAVLIFIISNRYLKISIDKFFIIKAIGIITVISGEYILAFSFNFLDYVAILVLPSYLFLTYILKLIDYKILFSNC